VTRAPIICTTFYDCSVLKHRHLTPERSSCSGTSAWSSSY